MRITSISEGGFDDKRDKGGFKAETAFKVTGRYGVQFAYTPDGEGFIWFETKQELLSEVLG